MATGGPWDADPFWYAKNGYEWSDANGWVRVRDAAPSPLYPDSRDATISSLRAELEVSEATNKAKTLMLADSDAALATAVEALEAAKTCINMTYGLQFKTFRQEHAEETAIVDQIEKALAAINAAMEGKT